MLNALHYVCWHLHGCMFTGYQAMRKLCKPEQSRQHLFLLAEIASFTWKYGFKSSSLSFVELHAVKLAPILTSPLIPSTVALSTHSWTPYTQYMHNLQNESLVRMLNARQACSAWLLWVRRRMQELKTNEQRASVEDLMYASVLEKFMELKVEMMPR